MYQTAAQSFDFSLQENESTFSLSIRGKQNLMAAAQKLSEMRNET